MFALQPATGISLEPPSERAKGAVTVTVSPGSPAHRFIPSRSLGAGADGHEMGETAQQLSPANIKAMLAAGLKPLSYRLRTELAGEAWHWNPNGEWSDSSHRQGYWTSSDKPGRPIRVSYGYRLPRRGNTIDQANDDGYSRIDDGDAATYWKSNPYLDESFTGDKGPESPQWVMIDLGAPKPVDAIRVLWARPFAVDYSVEYGEFVGEEDITQRLPSEWHQFPRGKVEQGSGGSELVKLADAPIAAQYVRIKLIKSSNTGPKSNDIRDRLGFAIREIYLGTLDARGRLVDAMDHGPAQNKQTDIYVSSTDPWHRAVDLDPKIEQPGFDFIFNSGLTNGQPMLLPVSVLFDTPENAAAEIRYLKARGYPIDRVEMGEEPDGQFIDPEQFAALYLVFQKSIHAVAPEVKLGGPSLQDIEQSQVPGRIEFGKAGWIGRFVSYLKHRDQLDKFTFFSFEWYAFPDDCEPEQLPESTQMLTDALDELQQGGLSRDIPWVMTEYGYSAFGARAEVDLDGALFNADSVARFLTMGGDSTYLYGYEPNEVIKEQKCSAGNNMLFFRTQSGRVKSRTAAFWGAHLLAKEWAQPGDQPHAIYPAASNILNDNQDQMVTAYAVHRPDGQWALMLINRDPDREMEMTVDFRDTVSGSHGSFRGPVDLYQYSPANYRLGGTADTPRPIKSEEPEHKTLTPTDPQLTRVTLPARSMTIIRGNLSF